jgi:hypothetical protein
VERLRQAVAGNVAERLRTMSRDELSWRVRTQLRTRGQEAAAVLRKPDWRREDVGQALAVDTLPREVQATIDAADWNGVHRGLRHLLRGRPSRFALNPARAANVRREIQTRWPEAEADAIARAGAIMDGRFDLLGYRELSFARPDGGIDWHLDPVHQRRMPMAFWSRVPYLDAGCGDHKVVWELNRQQHWLPLSRALWLTGDPAYARAIVGDLTGWMAANPPLLGVNWASMLELAFRSLSWLWGLHALLAFDGAGPAEAGHYEGEPWLVDVIVALDRQLRHVERNLSTYFSPNTHLTGEALALYVVGAGVPELAASARWLDRGRAVLLDEIDRQIEPDGGHAERSTHYHRYTLDFYLLALLTARRIGDSDAEERFSEVVRRLAPFARAMADRQGRLPRIGDDDAGQLWPIAGRDPADVRGSLGLAAALLDHREWAPWGVTEEGLWLTCNDPDAFERALTLGAEDRRIRERRTLPFRPAVRQVQSPDRSSLLVFPLDRRRVAAERRGRVGDRRSMDVAARPGRRQTEIFADTGYVTSATDSGDHLVFDAGPHGYLNGGHAHADALSIVLTLGHRPLLVDPGTPTYTMDPALRDESRSSESHNTITIDNQSSAVPRGPFQWKTRADARLEVVRHNSHFSLIEATHDGYRQAGHRRLILATDRGYLFVDQITGAGNHDVAQHWHFDPRWRVGCEAKRTLRFVHEGGEIAWLVHDRGALTLVNGDEASALGWISPAYGIRVPTWTARISEQAAAPLSLVTWCGASAGGPAPTLERLDHQDDGAAACVATRMHSGSSAWLSIVRPGDALGRQGRFARVSGMETDARALQWSYEDGRVSSVLLADGRYARLSDGLSIEADAVMPDLHVALSGHRLELSTSAPAVRLRLTGTALERITLIAGNGHTLRRLDNPCTAVVLTAPDWSEPVTGVEFQDQHDVRYRRLR